MPTQTEVEAEGTTSHDDAATSASVRVRRPSLARTVLGALTQVVAWLVILVVVGLLALAVVAPRVGGATPYTVLTGSMRPSFPPGTLVVAKPVDPADLKIGDVITFQLESGEATVVTHRVIGVRAGDEGEREFLTQGDANTTPDADAVREVQVRGRLWYSVPHLGRVNNLIGGDTRQLAVYGAAGALALYAAVMFAGAGRQQARGRRQS